MEVGNQNKVIDLGYRMIKDNIRNEIMVVKDYKNAIKLCYEYIEMVSNESEKIKLDCYMRTYYNLALCYLRLKNHKQGIKYLNMHLNYKKYMIPSELADTYWLQARAYESLNQMNNALKYYKLALNIYREEGIEQYRVTMLYKVCVLKNKKRSIYRLYRFTMKETHIPLDYYMKIISYEQIKRYFEHQLDILARLCA